jgi:hypothetical protein
MPMLNTNKLQGKHGGAWVNGVPTKSTAKGDEYRCPACAQNGGDEGGQHLIVFKDRPNFACAAYPGDKRHRADIWNTVGIANGGRPDPIIPRKTEQKATFIGRHVMDMKKLAKEVRERDYALKQARWERWKEEEQIARQREIDRQNEEARLQNEAIRLWKEREELERQERLKRPEEYNTNSKCDKTIFGTFGTPILSSTNMVPPLNKDYTNDTTVGMGGGYATPICEKASQTSQVRPTMPMGASPMPEGYCRTCWNKWGKMVREYEDIGCEICAAKEAVLV